MSLASNPYVQPVDEVIIAQGPPRRHRAFPTGVRLPNGDILVGYRDGSDPRSLGFQHGTTATQRDSIQPHII